MKPKVFIKDVLGELPFTAELYWLLRQRERKAFSRFNLEALKVRLPEMVSQVSPHADSAPAGKNVFCFASLHFWISHVAVTGLILRGLGHNVTLGYLPYSDFAKPINRFDLRRHDLYAKHVFQGIKPLLKTISFLDLEQERNLPGALAQAVEKVTVFDTQYTLQREIVAGNEPIYQLRHERNLGAACKAYAYFRKNRPDVVIVPNGMIQEFGAVYEAARFLDIPVTTYEFGEQDRRVWLGQNRQVMYHIVDEQWTPHRTRKLDAGQRTWLETFLAERQGLSTGDKFTHLWQKVSRTGGERTRQALGLDARPIVLLPTNVLGDSATLGRTVFSRSMADWVARTVKFLAGRPEVQLVVRIHPGETLTVGPSVAEIIQQTLPELPPHIRMIGATEKVNTYDLMEITDLALVYTTTAGLEMALRGIPVMVSGGAHYRKKGFTLDADSWEEYFCQLGALLPDLSSHRLTQEQVETAWNYAYFFFREYPRPFPWHIERLGKNLDNFPMAEVLNGKGRVDFETTFQQMAGMPVD